MTHYIHIYMHCMKKKIHTLTQNHSATTSTPQCGYSSLWTNCRWVERFVTQVTTKQLGLARRGTGIRFSWVEGKKLYLFWENRQ